MKKSTKSEKEIAREAENIREEIRPALYESDPESKKIFEEYKNTQKEWNEKIFQVTNLMKERYPELVKYLDEMTITIPDEKYPEVTIQKLKEYYDSLIVLLDRYLMEHPENAA